MITLTIVDGASAVLARIAAEFERRDAQSSFRVTAS
jgi:hypothetical protein